LLFADVPWLARAHPLAARSSFLPSKSKFQKQHEQNEG